MRTVGYGEAGAGGERPPDGPAGAVMTPAVIDILDRDGQVRQTVSVPGWPLSIGRALDNDLVLTDPHVAAHHLVVEPVEAGLELHVGDTGNGVRLGRVRLRRGDRHALPATSDGPAEFVLGRTRLRLHRPGDPLAPELPLVPAGSLTRRAAPVVGAALALLAVQLFTTYLASDPDGFGRAVGATLMTMLSGAVVWCGAWSLLSKTFTRQARFGWHLRVFLFGSLALVLIGALPPALAFMFSWPALTDFAFISTFVVGGIAVYFHLLAVEPSRQRLLRAVCVVGALTGIGLTLWLNVARTDLFGDELYMSHLLPPAMRLARPVPADRFVDGMSRLKPVLDRKAKEADSGSDAGPSGGESDE